MIAIMCEDRCGKTGNPIWYDQIVDDFVPRKRKVEEFFRTGKWACEYEGNPIIFEETMSNPYTFVIKNFQVYKVTGRSSDGDSFKLIADKEPCGRLELDGRDYYYRYIGKKVYGLTGYDFCTFNQGENNDS